jgi:hypothetical protein
VHQSRDWPDSIELVFQGLSCDVVEAFLDVGVQDVFGFESDVVEDRSYRVVGAASWPEPI